MTGLIVATFEAGVLTMTLNRPESRNAFSRALAADVRAAFEHWRERPDVRVCILTGAGDRAFCAGGDLKELSGMKAEADALQYSKDNWETLDAIRRFPAPVIGVLNGDALGGGAEVAMACDVRVAAAHARIGFLQSSLNITTAWGGGPDLFRLVGSSQAVRLLCSAELLDAERARDIGLIDAIVPAGDDGKAFLARYIEGFSQRPPQVTRAIKALAIQHRLGAPDDGRATTERKHFAAAWIHDDHWAAIAARQAKA